MYKRRKSEDTSGERPHLSIPRPEPCEKVRKPVSGNPKRKVVEIDLVSYAQDSFTIDL